MAEDTSKSPDIALWVLLTIGMLLIIYVVGSLWSIAFVYGALGGPYRALMFWYNSLGSITPLLGLIGLVVLALGIGLAVMKRPAGKDVIIGGVLPLGTAVLLLLISLAGCAWAPWNHMDTYTISGKTYQLGSTTTYLESHFFVFECNASGRNCTQNYREFSDGQPQAQYSFVERESSVAVVAGHNPDKVLYEISLP